MADDQKEDSSRTSFRGCKNAEERLNLLQKLKGIESKRILLNNEEATRMIENCIGIVGIPLGIVPYVLINQKEYVAVPFAIEEPSIIAACSSACKIIKKSGGFIDVSSPPFNSTVVQLQITKMDSNKEKTKLIILSNKQKILDKANEFCKQLKARGGGVVDVLLRDIPDLTPRTNKSSTQGWTIIHLVRHSCFSYLDS